MCPQRQEDRSSVKHNYKLFCALLLLALVSDKQCWVLLFKTLLLSINGFELVFKVPAVWVSWELRKGQFIVNKFLGFPASAIILLKQKNTKNIYKSKLILSLAELREIVFFFKRTIGGFLGISQSLSNKMLFLQSGNNYFSRALDFFLLKSVLSQW